MAVGTLGSDQQLTGDPSAERDRDAVGARLIEQLATDLDAGFAALMHEHQGVVYSVLLRACHHPGDAEDLAAEAFLRAYRALRSYDRERIVALRLRPWLITIALNCWRNLVRHRTRRPAQVSLEHAAEQPAGGDAFERLVDRMAGNRQLAMMIADLPEQQRLAVVLRHVCDLSVTETAEVLGHPEGTVRSLASRGLGALRQRWAVPECPQPPP